MATYLPKTWQDELTPYPYRYKITHQDSTEEQVNIVGDYGTPTQSGDHFDAQTFNDLEDRIAAGFATCNNALYGTVDPTSADGKNGDTYYKTETVGNVTTVIATFIKLGGEWLEISASLPQAEGGGF